MDEETLYKLEQCQAVAASERQRLIDFLDDEGNGDFYADGGLHPVSVAFSRLTFVSETLKEIISSDRIRRSHQTDSRQNL